MEACTFCPGAPGVAYVGLRAPGQLAPRPRPVCKACRDTIAGVHRAVAMGEAHAAHGQLMGLLAAERASLLRQMGLCR